MILQWHCPHAELILQEHKVVFVSQMKSVSQRLQKMTDKIYSLHIMPMFSWCCWETAEKRGLWGTAAVSARSNPSSLIEKNPALASSHTAHTHTHSYIHSLLLSHTHFFPAALLHSVIFHWCHCDQPGTGSIRKWVSSGVKHAHSLTHKDSHTPTHTQFHMSTCTHTVASRHNDGFRRTFAKAVAQSCPFSMAWIMDKCGGCHQIITECLEVPKHRTTHPPLHTHALTSPQRWSPAMWGGVGGCGCHECKMPELNNSVSVGFFNH